MPEQGQFNEQVMPQQEGAPQAPPSGDQGGEQDQQMLAAVGEMADIIIQEAGLPALAEVLQQALQQLTGGGQQPQGPPQQQEPQLPTSQPPPGGEAFKQSFG
jgi:hypothetical protein